MSDVSQGPGWWLASDGKWYSPEQAPGYASPPPMPNGTVAPPGAAAPGPGVPPYPGAPTAGSYGPPPVAAGYGVPAGGTGYGPPPDPGYGYGYGYGGGGPYGYVPARRTNGLAIASLVCSFFFWLYGVGAVLAIVFGFIARSQIKRSGDTQQGNGLALAGIIIGFVGIVLMIAIVVVVAAVVHHCDQNGNCTSNTIFNNGN
ncbi:MAG: DUF4190 domain-containing protein [Acidimicrobiales bacterium]